MKEVKAKKHLGQHFLRDEGIAGDIADALTLQGYTKALEIGPGMGVMTKYLLQKNNLDLEVVEIDRESVSYLQENYPQLDQHIRSEDFLKMDLSGMGPIAIIGNFPYNISSQIMFKVLDHIDEVPELVGMFQKEVAERFAAKPHSKTYGILSVLLQAYYDVEYLFTVPEHVFSPPPKVKSGVIRMIRKPKLPDIQDPAHFKKLIKTAFNQRRKTMRNSLKSYGLPDDLPGWDEFAKLRPEQLSYQDFIRLSQLIREA